MAPSVSIVLGALQAALLILYFTCTTTTHDAFTLAEYNIFRDIMVMLLLGFGFLMTFLRLYGLSSVGLTLLVTVLAIQLNVLVEPLIRFLYKGNSSSSSGGVDFPIPVDMSNLMDGEFAAATALISFGAVIGRATPLQLVAMVVLQAFFYAINKVVIVLGVLGAEDVGGTLARCCFGSCPVCVCLTLCRQRSVCACQIP